MEPSAPWGWLGIVAVGGLTLSALGTLIQLLRPRDRNLWGEIAPLIQAMQQNQIATTAVMTRIGERIEHIPTTAQLQTEMKDTRHDLKNTAESIHMKVQAGFRDMADEFRTVAREIRREP